jgi:hypothetical protein
VTRPASAYIERVATDKWDAWTWRDGEAVTVARGTYRLRVVEEVNRQGYKAVVLDRQTKTL